MITANCIGAKKDNTNMYVYSSEWANLFKNITYIPQGWGGGGVWPKIYTGLDSCGLQKQNNAFYNLIIPSFGWCTNKV
jgi:hypothetical protein